MCCYLRLLQEAYSSSKLTRNKAFTLVEVLIVAFISVVLFGALFMVLNMGDLQSRIGGTRIEVQGEVRRAMDWMSRDLRQTSRGQMSVLNASAASFAGLGTPEVFETPDFPICTGFNPGAGGIQWSTYTISYDFDPTNQTITRTFSDPISGDVLTYRFNHINSLTFTKIEEDSLEIDISGQKVAKRGISGNMTQMYNLTEQIKLRN